MTASRRSRNLRTWQTRGRRGSDEYFLMVRVNDWKLQKKTDFIRTLVHDEYLFPPFQHITLYGPFFLRDGLHQDTLCQAIESACGRSPGFILKLSGWIMMRGRKGLAIAHDVKVSSAFREFYDHLWQSLTPLTDCLSWIDRDPLQRRFHITHSYNMRTRDAESVCGVVRSAIEMKNKEKTAVSPDTDTQVKENSAILLPEHVPFTIFRIALLRNGSVRAEFDMPSGTWLPRGLAYRHEKTAVSLKQYRRISGIELVSPLTPPETPPFVVSDLHLGHENIIKYCRRPFSSAAEMDEVLINNWNRVVRGEDEILFLGDLRYGPGAATREEYLNKLAGKITFVKGNHDEDSPDEVPYAKKIFGGIEFLFIHDPTQASADFQGWIIHGHAHNNDIREFPFVDYIHRRVNVSVEMTGYRPVSLTTILGYIRDRGGRDRIDIMPMVPPLTGKNQE
jgi:calcineurin-like phosphoesterase family protein